VSRRARARVLCVAAAVGLLWPAAAGAQVNTERLRRADGAEGFSGSVEASFANRTGNTDLAEGGLSLGVGWRGGPRTALFLADVDAGRARDETTVNRGFVHLRGGRDLTARVTWEVFVQHEYDRLARLTARSLVGTGPRFTLLKRKRATVHLGVAYMFEREEVDLTPGSSEAPVQRNHRASSYLALALGVGARVSFGNTVYVQPRIAEARDVRVLEEATVKVGLVGALSLKVALTVRYDGEPPAGVKDLDTAVTNRLAWDF
jgi:putative salt-induced outer membrane protein YdiY